MQHVLHYFKIFAKCLQSIYKINSNYYFYLMMSPEFQFIVLDNQTDSAAGGIKGLVLEVLGGGMMDEENINCICSHFANYFVI